MKSEDTVEFCVRTWKYEVCMYPQKGEVDGQTVSFPFFVWQRGYTCTRRTFKSRWSGHIHDVDYTPIDPHEAYEFDKGPTSDPTSVGQTPEGGGRDLIMIHVFRARADGGFGGEFLERKCPSNGPGKCMGEVWDPAGTRARWGRRR